MKKASLSALTQISEFEFYNLLENLVSREQLMKDECPKHHFQELFNLLILPNQLIQDIASSDIPEAQLLVTNKITLMSAIPARESCEKYTNLSSRNL